MQRYFACQVRQSVLQAIVLVLTAEDAEIAEKPKPNTIPCLSCFPYFSSWLRLVTRHVSSAAADGSSRACNGRCHRPARLSATPRVRIERSARLFAAVPA